MDFWNAEAVVRRCTSNRRPWRFCNAHMKTPVLEFLFNKYAGLKTWNFNKNRLRHRYFPVELAKFLRTPFFTEHIQWLLLEISQELSLYCIWEQWMVSFCGTYWLPSVYFIFFTCVSFHSIPFFISCFFCVDSTTFRFWGKFINT